MHVSRRLFAHTPKQSWNLGRMRGFPLAAGLGGLMGAKCRVHFVGWQGAWWWPTGTSVLGRKPPCHRLTAKPQGFSVTREQDSGRGPAPLSWGQGAFRPARGEERGLRQVVGSWQEGTGRNCDTSQYQSYFSKGQHFIVQFYAAILHRGRLSQRTLSRLLVPGDLKLQPGQGSGARAILNSSQHEQEVPVWW